MKNYVVENYENYREEDRLSTNNARKIEFITTSRIFDELFDGSRKIFDCAAGTGIYAFHLAEQGHEVTATDITPRHVEIMDKIIAEKGYNVKTAVLDACDMSIYGDESFDVVLNMGPFYHLIDEEKRVQCMKESLRVLKKGGILAAAYIPRYYIFQFIAMDNDYFLDADLANQLISTGVLRHDDENVSGRTHIIPQRRKWSVFTERMVFLLSTTLRRTAVLHNSAKRLITGVRISSEYGAIITILYAVRNQPSGRVIMLLLLGGKKNENQIKDNNRRNLAAAIFCNGLLLYDFWNICCIRNRTLDKQQGLLY